MLSLHILVEIFFFLRSETQQVSFLIKSIDIKHFHYHYTYLLYNVFGETPLWHKGAMAPKAQVHRYFLILFKFYLYFLFFIYSSYLSYNNFSNSPTMELASYLPGAHTY